MADTNEIPSFINFTDDTTQIIARVLLETSTKTADLDDPGELNKWVNS